jgi:PleD family two-component response regulator
MWGRDGSPVKFTVSIGVARADGCRDLQGLLARADLALYEAKRAGRARWHAFEETEQPDPFVPVA